MLLLHKQDKGKSERGDGAMLRRKVDKMTHKNLL